jgi:hypothetical protein
VAGIVTGQDTGQSVAAYDLAHRKSVEERGAPRWYARGCVGLGWVVRSEQESALRQQGYDSSFASYYGLDAAYLFSSWAGVGMWGFFSERGDSVEGLPTFEETVFGGGLQAPLVLIGDPKVLIIVAGRIGIAHGRQQVHGAGEFVEGPAFGFDYSVVFPKLYAGLAGGFFWAPVPASGELGSDGNFGRGYMALLVHFDG